MKPVVLGIVGDCGSVLEDLLAAWKSRKLSPVSVSPLSSLVHAGVPTADPWLADDATETRGNNVDAQKKTPGRSRASYKAETLRKC